MSFLPPVLYRESVGHRPLMGTMAMAPMIQVAPLAATGQPRIHSRWSGGVGPVSQVVEAPMESQRASPGPGKEGQDHHQGEETLRRRAQHWDGLHERTVTTASASGTAPHQGRGNGG